LFCGLFGKIKEEKKNRKMATDHEDFSNPIIVSEYTTKPITLWNNEAVPAGSVTSEVDVSKVASLGVFIEVSSATTVEFQVETATGWKVFDSISFAAADHFFYNVWILPFTKIRFKTTEATTITVQVFLRT